MQPVMGLTLCLCLAVHAAAQSERGGPPRDQPPAKAPGARGRALTDPTEIFKKADHAAKNVKTVRYTASTRFTGFLAQRRPAVDGTVTLGKHGSFYGFGEFLFDVHLTSPGKEHKKEHFVVASDGKQASLIDFANKVVTTRRLKTENDCYACTGRPGAAASRLGMVEFVHPEPFHDEITAFSSKLIRTEKVDGEPCYVLSVVYTGGRGQSVWYISMNDFLPRRREIPATDFWSGQRGVRRITIHKLEVNPKLPEDAFSPKAPNGFKTMRQPAS